MRKTKVLVLHSDVGPDAPPDELDTLDQANAIASALSERGHSVVKVPFKGEEALKALLAAATPEVVFNLVEAVDGKGLLAVGIPGLLERLGARYTGASEQALREAGNKPFAKAKLRKAGLPTPDWSEPPDWEGVGDNTVIVKSALEDCSLGLDDDSLVKGRAEVEKRAAVSREKFGGRWFAEEYVDGREFNIAVLEDHSAPRVLPLAEMTFQEWQEGRPRIVGYRAKWADGSFESTRTVRAFGFDEMEPDLAANLRELASRAWTLFGLTGYARVDFRVDKRGEPMILELNPNPCLSPDAGFAAAAERTGLSYADLMEHIVTAALE